CQRKLPQANRLLTDGLTVYAGTPGMWTALRAEDGVPAWQYFFGNGRTQSKGVLTDRLLIFAQEDGPIYFVEKRSGADMGALNFGDGFSSTPAVVGNVLFALSDFGHVYTDVL